MTPAELQVHLEDALMDVLDGSPWGPLLAARIRTASEAVLRSHRLRGRVQVTEGGRRVQVALVDGPRVRQVVLTLGRQV